MEQKNRKDVTPTANRNVNEKTRRCHLSASSLIAVELLAIIVTAIVVWVLFALPSVFYLTRPRDKGTSTATSLATNCTPIIYSNNESVCYPFLERYKECILTMRNEKDIYISSTVNVAQSEEIAIQVENLQNILSPQCRTVALPFICLYLFPLCDQNSTIHLPSSDECVSISTDTCKSEWTTAKAVIRSLPICSSLPTVSPCNQYNATTSDTSPILLTSSNCSENFVFTRNSCLPDCPKWELQSTSGTINNVIVIMAAVVGSCTGIFVLVISVVKHKRMFAFPSILVFYQTVVTVLLALFSTISLIDPKSLYCTTPDWITSLNHTTTFCSIAGSVLLYGMLQLNILWISHIGVIFWTVRFPVEAIRHTPPHRMKYIHGIILLAAVIIPVASVVAAFEAGGFVNARFPPLLCLPKNSETSYFTLVLPTSIILPCGVTMLLIVFWTIHKQNIIRSEQVSKTSIQLGTAEKKVLIVFFYYVLLGIIALVAFSVNARVSDDFMNSLILYFACEGKTPGSCAKAKSQAMKYSYSFLTDTAYILLALFPLVNLVYAVQFSDLKSLCKKLSCFKCLNEGGKNSTKVTFSTHDARSLDLGPD